MGSRCQLLQAYGIEVANLDDPYLVPVLVPNHSFAIENDGRGLSTSIDTLTNN